MKKTSNQQSSEQSTQSSDNLNSNQLLSSILGNTKLLLVIVPLVIILIGLLIWGFIFYKNNWLDGRKTDVGQFSSINSNLPYSVRIIKSDKNRVEVSYNENYYYDRIDFDIIEGELKLKSVPKLSVAKLRAPEVLIYSTSLSKVINNNKGNITIDSIVGTNVELDSKDKGNIMVETLTATQLTASVHDSGNVVVNSGKAGSIEANVVNSGGKINLIGVESPTAKVKDIGTGTIKLNPSTVVEGEKKGRK